MNSLWSLFSYFLTFLNLKQFAFLKEYIPSQFFKDALAISIYLPVVILGCLIGFISTIYLLFFTDWWLLTIFYLIWIYVFDKHTCERGGRSIQWVKDLKIWKLAIDYFPVKLVKEKDCELDPEKNYLFCCFPHGYLNTGPPLALSPTCSGFSKLFPHHKAYIAVLKVLISLPFHRDLLYALGLVSVSANSLNYLLGKKDGGNVVAVMVGGAEEAFYCKPGSYKVVLKNRKGFVKIAMKNGAPLVPVVSFRETDLYDQYEGPRIRRFQDWFKKRFHFSMLIPKGRGFIQPSMIPNKAPITLCGKHRYLIVNFFRAHLFLGYFCQIFYVVWFNCFNDCLL